MSKALEALADIEQLIRWHLCEQEGMASGQPTPEEWENAVDAAGEAVQTIRAALEQTSTAENWKPSDREYDRSIHHNPDAAAWADFFMDTFPNCGADRDTMFGWFANAMMAVADSQPSTAEIRAQALEEAADCGEFSAWAKGRLIKMAKRIRGKG